MNVSYRLTMTVSIAEKVRQIQEQVRERASGRAVTIVGVTKTVPAQGAAEAYAAGLQIFGENRIQEALPKISQLSNLAITWHFIGHLQTNKAREAVRNFSCIQSIDSLKLLQQVEKEARKSGKRMDIFLELNLGNEESKHGFAESEISAALQTAAGMMSLNLRGLMAIPPFVENPEAVRPYFKRMRELAGQHNLPELSMGMSHDYLVAIEEGSTMIRVGTAIFGQRS